MFGGTISEPASVTIQGRRARVDGGTAFEGTATVAPGVNDVIVTAVDAAGNATTRGFRVTTGSQLRTFVHDANGNVASDGERAFEWDAQNRLVRVSTSAVATNLHYDGRSRLRRIERTIGQSVETIGIGWCGNQMCEEERGGQVRPLYERGRRVTAGSEYFIQDHLGSVVAVVTPSGGVSDVRDYGPFGEIRSGSNATEVGPGFTGHLRDGATGLLYTQFRAYDPRTASWMSRDPLGLPELPYAYVAGDPVNDVDVYGLQASGGGRGDSDGRPNCRNCTNEEAKRIRDANDKICHNADMSPGCSSLLRKEGMHDCMIRKTCLPNAYQVRCEDKPWNIDCGGTPPLGNGEFLYLNPGPFQYFNSSCGYGNVAYTLAHELSHVCGVGPDGPDPEKYPPYANNLAKAEAIAAACSGPSRF